MSKPNRSVAAFRNRKLATQEVIAGLTFQAAEQKAAELRAHYGRGYIVRRTGYRVGPVRRNQREHKVTVYRKES